MDPGTTNKYQSDFGAIVVLDRIGEKTGWMGYGAYGSSDLNKRDHWNRGYPSCQSDYVEKPAGCQTARLYGDTKECVIGGILQRGIERVEPQYQLLVRHQPRAQWQRPLPLPL